MPRSSTTIQKGHNPNPTGRPKTPEWLKDGFKGLTPLAFAALRAVLDGMDTEAKTSDRLKATDMVFDRTLGKPLQQVKSEVTMTDRVDTSKLSAAEKDVLARLALGEIEENVEDFNG